jgi:hypothetical protein
VPGLIAGQEQLLPVDIGGLDYEIGGDDFDDYLPNSV